MFQNSVFDNVVRTWVVFRIFIIKTTKTLNGVKLQDQWETNVSFETQTITFL